VVGDTYGDGVDLPRRRHRPLSLASLRAHVTRFEITHGVTAANWREAFRDATGRLHENDEYLTMDGLYWLLGPGLDQESARA